MSRTPCADQRPQQTATELGTLSDELSHVLEAMERVVAQTATLADATPMAVEALHEALATLREQHFRALELASLISQQVCDSHHAQQERRARLAALTQREQQVFTLVVAGKLNKQIAKELGITERTIKAHRAEVMRKLKVGSLAGLVQLADRLGVPAPAQTKSPSCHPSRV